MESLKKKLLTYFEENIEEYVDRILKDKGDLSPIPKQLYIKVKDKEILNDISNLESQRAIAFHQSKLEETQEEIVVPTSNLNSSEKSIYDIINLIKEFISDKDIELSSIIGLSDNEDTLLLWGYNLKVSSTYLSELDMTSNTIFVKADKVSGNITTTGSVEIDESSEFVGKIFDKEGQRNYE